MPPWIYSNGFWANLWEVMFPHQWLAARTAGVDLAKVLDGSEVVGQDGTECEPVVGEGVLADGDDNMSPDSVAAGSKPAGVAGQTAATAIESRVTRRHVHAAAG